MLSIDLKPGSSLFYSFLSWKSEHNTDQAIFVIFQDADGRWADIYVTQVIDACHFWAHVGGKPVIEKMEAVNRKLLAQVILNRGQRFL